MERLRCATMALVAGCVLSCVPPAGTAGTDDAEGTGDTLEQVQTPTYSPAPGEYAQDIEVQIACATAGAAIHYTTDGSTPDATSAPCQAPLPVTGDGTSVTFAAVATREGMLQSEIAQAVYSVVYPPDDGLIDDWPQDQTVLTLTDAAASRVTVTVTLTNDAGLGLTKVSVAIPLPRTNCYQQVANVAAGAGEVLPIRETSDTYVRFLLTDSLPGPGESVEVSIWYDVTLHTVDADLAAVGDAQQPDTASDIWTYYRGSSGDLVVPDHLQIAAVGASLFADAGGELLEYARLCYRWTAQNVAYASTTGTWTDLADILTPPVQGECGDFASVFVSLLRNRDIPARHLASVRPDGSYHVWADFFLFGYGWIPADPTYARTYCDAHGTVVDDYFGHVEVATSGIIMHKEVHLLVDADGEYETYLDGLQTFAYWNWYSSGGPGNLTATYTLEAQPL